MKAFTAIGFNLTINAVFGFWGALLVAYLVIHALRIGPGRGRFALLVLPFVKVAFDLARGVPDRSFLWPSLSGTRQELGSFQFGVGFELPAVPIFRLLLSSHAHGLVYPQSAGDLAYRALAMRVSPELPLALLAVAFGVAAARVLLRVARLVQFSREVRRWLAGARCIGVERVGSRRVRIYVNDRYRGAPFTASLLAPFVLFSSDTLAALDENERRAVTLHELAHAQKRDPAKIVLLSFVGDLLWFVPGQRGLVRRLLADIELEADAAALRRGAKPDALSRALLRVAEMLAFAPYSAAGLIGKKRLLRERLSHLLEPRRAPRAPYRHAFGKALVLGLTAACVLRSVFLGNSGF